MARSCLVGLNLDNSILKREQQGTLTCSEGRSGGGMGPPATKASAATTSSPSGVIRGLAMGPILLIFGLRNCGYISVPSCYRKPAHRNPNPTAHVTGLTSTPLRLSASTEQCRHRSLDTCCCSQLDDWFQERSADTSTLFSLQGLP